MIKDLYEFNGEKFIIIGRQLVFQSSKPSYLCTVQNVDTLEVEGIFESHLNKSGTANIKIEVSDDRD